MKTCIVTRPIPPFGDKWGVYMTPGRLLPQSEFTPVPSHRSIFVYMTLTPKLMLCWHESPWREFTPVLVPGREFHSSTKSRNGIM